MAKLIIKEGPGRGTAYELTDESVTIGRDPTNVIQIPSETVSRTHAILSSAEAGGGDVWTIKDMHSKNGMFLNGQRVESATLGSGDQIRLGEALLSFILRDFEAIGEDGLAQDDDTMQVRDRIERDTIMMQPGGAGVTAEVGPDPQQTLMGLLEFNGKAAGARSYADLFEALSAAIEKYVQPHRTVPILFDEKKGLLRPWVRQKGEFDKVLARIPISSSIVRYVQQHRCAVVSESTQKDERFMDARSVATNEIASAMCAPLLIGNRLLGAVYVDRLGDAERFASADLKLLSAFAVQAAVAVETVRMREEVGRERYVREKEARGEYDIVGECEAMQRIFRFISKAAPTDASVLIEGESGTGKELVARAVHLNSQRRHQPFEAVNCAAMAPTLLESELFGHVRGAFTGADKNRPGRFELADGGTLFLDEIGELPESSQSKLLRVIETGELRRVGDVKDIQVNVRVVAATNKVLAEEVKKGHFREDLYFRLNVLRVALPPLRARESDMRLLAEHFLKYFAHKCGRQDLRFDEGALKVFEGYPWPGNVREMRNAVERMVVMAEGAVLDVADVPFEIRTAPAPGDDDSVAVAEGEDLPPLREVEKRHIARVMRQTGGNKKEAARVLGIDRSTLYAKLKAHNLED